MCNNKRTKEGALLVPTTVRFPLSKITLFQHIAINHNQPKHTTNNPSIKSSNKFLYQSYTNWSLYLQHQMRIYPTYRHCSQHAEVKQSYWLVNITDERKGQRSCHCIVLISPFSAYSWGNAEPTMTLLPWYKHNSRSVGNTHLLFHLLHLKFIKNIL